VTYGRQLALLFGLAAALLLVAFWLIGEKTNECYDRGGIEVVGRDLICIDAEGRVLR
jgi:hypothetical protein